MTPTVDITSIALGTYLPILYNPPSGKILGLSRSRYVGMSFCAKQRTAAALGMRL